MGKISNLAQGNQDQQMSAATKKHLANIIAISVGDATMTPAEIAKVFDDRVATLQAAQAAKAASNAAIKTNRDKRTATAPFVKSFKGVVRGMFSSPGTLADFGLTPSKTGTRPAATKAAAVLKGKATRAARNTMGKKQTFL